MKHIYAPGYKLFQFTSITVNEAIPSNYQRILLAVFNGTFFEEIYQEYWIGKRLCFPAYWLEKHLHFQ